MDYVDFLYFGKGNFSHIYDCERFLLLWETIYAYLIDFKRVYREFNNLLPLSLYVEVQPAQRK